MRLPADRDGTVQPGDGLKRPTSQPGAWGRGFLFVGENEARAASPRWCWLSLGAGASLLPAGSPPSPTALSRGPALRTAWALSGVAVASVPAPPQSSLQAWEESRRGEIRASERPVSGNPSRGLATGETPGSHPPGQAPRLHHKLSLVMPSRRAAASADSSSPALCAGGRKGLSEAESSRNLIP